MFASDEQTGIAREFDALCLLLIRLSFDATNTTIIESEAQKW